MQGWSFLLGLSPNKEGKFTEKYGGKHEWEKCPHQNSPPNSVVAIITTSHHVYRLSFNLRSSSSDLPKGPVSSWVK